MTTPKNTALVAYQERETPGLVTPLVDPADAAAAIARYEELKKAIVRPDDKQIISGREFLKKSFWRRVATCFGLSLELVSEERLILDGKLAYRVMYRASAPNGRWMDGDGMCTQGEKGQMIEHNIRAIAHTRAKNRAISDLVGGGEVSAEEMSDDDSAPHPPRPPRPPARMQPHPGGAQAAAPVARVVEAETADDDDEAIPYTLDEDEPAAETAPAPEEPEQPTALQLRRIESLCGLLGKPFDASKIRDAAHAEHIRIELDRQWSARQAAETAKKKAPTRGNRGPSALAANGEGPVPASLESLDTGTRAS